MQRRELALRRECENRAFARMDGAATSVITALKSCAVEVAIRRLDEWRPGAVPVLVVKPEPMQHSNGWGGQANVCWCRQRAERKDAQRQHGHGTNDYHGSHPISPILLFTR